VPTLTRDDGVEIHWEERGDGPLVILASYWQSLPSVFDNLIAELGGHRVVTYDARGTGRSTRRGPYDMETSAGDLAAVAEASGGGAMVVAVVDASNRAVRVADAHPELVSTVVAAGTPPVSRDLFRDSDSLAASDNVIEAFLEMLESSYRGALRALVPAANPQMSEEEVDRRIDEQAEYSPREVAVAGARAWVEDDPVEAARRIGERLLVVYSEEMAGPWLPPGSEMAEIVGRALPKARLIEVADGIVSRPDLTAAVVREVTTLESSP
jgi:pimeloyl-ACP methyl ester carboxylesterase